MKSELSASAGWAVPGWPRRLPAAAPTVLLVAATVALLLAGALWPAWRTVAWWLLPPLGLGAWLHGRRRHRRALEERREWRTKIDDAGLSLAQWVHGESVAASPGWLARLGPLAPADPLAWLEQVHAVDRMKLQERLPALLQGPPPGAGDDTDRAGGVGTGSGASLGPDADTLLQALRLPDDSGGWIWHELRLRVARRDPRGHARQVLASLQDIQWRRTAEERQRMSSGLFQHLHEGLAITDLEHRLLDANPAYWSLMAALLDTPAGLVIENGAPPPDAAEATRRRMLGRPVPPLDPAQLRRAGHDPDAIAEALADPAGHWSGLVKVRAAGGLPRTWRLTVSSIPEPEGPPRYRVLALSDLTQELQRQQALERLGRFDLLTGLPNEQEFLRRLQGALHTSRQVGPGFMLCVARVDLDGFAAFNRRHGIARADQAMRELARRLTQALRQASQWSDEVARLGGDEFGLLLRVRSVEEAQEALDRLVRVLRDPIEPDGDAPLAPADDTTPTAPMAFDGALAPDASPGGGSGHPHDLSDGALRLSASVGATLSPQDGGEAETLLRHAAHALYRVKRSGRDGVQFFDVEKRRSREAQAQAALRVQQALEAGELCLHYQPKLDLVSGALLGAEALLRWRHPQRGLLAPAAFLPTVEHSGMAAQLGHWVLEQALAQSRLWRAEGLDLELSVNISPRHLSAPAFVPRLEALLARHPDVPPQRLVLELLESSALDDAAQARRLLTDCKRLGLRLAMDDFGTGYATLSVLKQLPLDQLKIDRSFVQTMLVDPQDRALVQGVIALAGQFGCEVVAEGVESPAHARALVELGCRVGQGSGLCEPLPPQALPAWARHRATIAPPASPCAPSTPSREAPPQAIT